VIGVNFFENRKQPVNIPVW